MTTRESPIKEYHPSARLIEETKEKVQYVECCARVVDSVVDTVCKRRTVALSGKEYGWCKLHSTRCRALIAKYKHAEWVAVTEFGGDVLTNMRIGFVDDSKLERYLNDLEWSRERLVAFRAALVSILSGRTVAQNQCFASTGGDEGHRHVIERFTAVDRTLRKMLYPPVLETKSMVSLTPMMPSGGVMVVVPTAGAGMSASSSSRKKEPPYPSAKPRKRKPQVHEQRAPSRRMASEQNRLIQTTVDDAMTGNYIICLTNLLKGNIYLQTKKTMHIVALPHNLRRMVWKQANHAVHIGHAMSALVPFSWRSKVTEYVFGTLCLMLSGRSLLHFSPRTKYELQLAKVCLDEKLDTEGANSMATNYWIALYNVLQHILGDKLVPTELWSPTTADPLISENLPSSSTADQFVHFRHRVLSGTLRLSANDTPAPRHKRAGCATSEKSDHKAVSSGHVHSLEAMVYAYFFLYRGEHKDGYTVDTDSEIVEKMRSAVRRNAVKLLGKPTYSIWTFVEGILPWYPAKEINEINATVENIAKTERVEADQIWVGVAEHMRSAWENALLFDVTTRTRAIKKRLPTCSDWVHGRRSRIFTDVTFETLRSLTCRMPVVTYEMMQWLVDMAHLYSRISDIIASQIRLYGKVDSFPLRDESSKEAKMQLLWESKEATRDMLLLTISVELASTESGAAGSRCKVEDRLGRLPSPRPPWMSLEPYLHFGSLLCTTRDDMARLIGAPFSWLGGLKLNNSEEQFYASVAITIMLEHFIELYPV